MNKQPKGSMCANCVHKLRKCDHLDFNSMLPIEKPNIVKCVEFEKL